MPCIIKEVIFPVSYKTQLWNLTFSSAWTTSCLTWVFCKAVYCILQLKLNLIQSLENSLDGQLKVIYGDFFRLDPLVTGTVKPPAVCSDKLFEAMGVAAVPWRAGMRMRLHTLQTHLKVAWVVWKNLWVLRCMLYLNICIGFMGIIWSLPKFQPYLGRFVIAPKNGNMKSQLFAYCNKGLV